MTQQALKKYEKDSVRIVAWPESSFKGVMRDRYFDNLTRTLRDFVKANDISLITGGYYKNKEEIFTGFFIFQPTGDIQKYLKNHLVPFGEFFPGKNKIEKCGAECGKVFCLMWVTSLLEKRSKFLI